MSIPVSLEFDAIRVYCVQKQEVEEPEMLWFVDIEMMETFEATEKASPSPNKLAAHLDP